MKKENWAAYVDKRMQEAVEKSGTVEDEHAALKTACITTGAISARKGIPLFMLIAVHKELMRRTMVATNTPTEKITDMLFLFESWVREGYEQEAKNGSV